MSHFYPLKSATSPEWIVCVAEDFDAFLVDHAACERKAMATAMSLISRFSHFHHLVEPMICLAQEELAHFHEVFRILRKRGLDLELSTQDLYVTRLRKAIRDDEKGYLVDRLLISALIEARSSERLEIVGSYLGGSGHELAAFYQSLAKVERGHWRVFYQQAKMIDSFEVDLRLDELASFEGEVIGDLPCRAAVH